MKNLAFVVCFFVVLLSTKLSAQSITIGTVPGTTFCAGDTVRVPYTATGIYTARNSFIVQISDANGSFASFTNAGDWRSSESGVIPAVIPNDIPLGFKYRFRVVSSDPFVVSSNISDADISLGPAPDASFEYDRDYEFMFTLVGRPVTFTSSSTNASVLWDFGPDAVPQTSTERTPTVTFTEEGFKSIKLTAFGVGGCSRIGGNGNLENIYIGSCMPTIPEDALVDSVDNINTTGYETIWVVPGGRLRSYRGFMVFAEAGATVDMSEITTIYYMKAGSVLKDIWTGFIVYEDGASIAEVEQRRDRTYHCPDLEFDYSDAPPYKIRPASVSRVKGSSVSIYPNPVASKLIIEHKETTIREVIIRNTLGAEQLFVKPEGLGSTSIDVSRLAAGLYFVDIIRDSGTETHKIVVSK